MMDQTLIPLPVMDVRQAVRKAREYFDDFYKDDKLPGVLLEEVTLSDNGKTWEITFGYDTNRPAERVESPLGAISTRGNLPKFIRDYKTIRIRASDGALLGMKIR